MHIYVSKNSVVSKDVIFYIVWYNVKQQYMQKIFFLLFYSFLVKFID